VKITTLERVPIVIDVFLIVTVIWSVGQLGGSLELMGCKIISVADRQRSIP